MVRQAEGWRVDRQDEEIKRLRERLYEAEGKIRKLEMRPWEWAWKVEIFILWAAIVAMWIVAIIEISTKN